MGPRRPGRPAKTDYATYDEAAAILGVTKYTVVRMVKDGRLRASVTKGGYHRILRSVVEEYASERGADIQS